MERFGLGAGGEGAAALGIAVADAGGNFSAKLFQFSAS